MKEKEFDRLCKETFTNTLRQRKKCLVENCEQIAIKSHIVQRNGILNRLITDGHLYEITYLQFPKGSYYIKRIGWKEAFTFYGLCSDHDSRMFEQIEKESVDFEDYQSLLLLSYRVLLNEYRLKEVLRDSFLTIHSNKDAKTILDPQGMQILIEAQNLMIWDLEFLIKSLEEDLVTHSKQYYFYSCTLPLMGICTSTVFSYKSLADSFPNFPNLALETKELISNIILHLIPTSGGTKVILGYHVLTEKDTKPKIDSFMNLDDEQKLKEISDMLIKYCGVWACSEHFYCTHIKHRETEVLRLLNNFTLRKQFSNEKIELNLFRA